jgi:spermidine/putrescine transport system substrate-binding protein
MLRFAEYFIKGVPMNRALLASLLALLLLPAALGQGWQCPEGFEGQQLNVYNWTTYIAEDTISNFEALCGVSVTYDTYPTDDDMLARIRQGNPGYDIVVPSSTVMYLMIEENLLEPLDHSKIPNLANLDPEFMDLDFDPGNLYSVPYQWGTLGIGYNVERVGREVTSWRDMFEHDGPVSWMEDIRATLGVALLMLGYDPNTSDPGEIAAARDFLIENGGNVIYINQDDGQEWLLRGEVDMVVEYSGDIFQIMDECECDTFDYVIPEEGTLFWVDNVAIPQGTQNPELAHVFLDYLLDPQVGADISNYTAYGTPNRAAIEQGLIDEELLGDPGIYPSAETLGRLFTVVQDSNLEQLYNDAWDEVKIFIGR